MGDFRGLFVGLTTIDIQYFVEEFPSANQKIKTKAPDILVGGPATNAAVAFSFLNDGAHLLTSVGESPFSTFVHNDFRQNNLQWLDVSEGKTEPVIASVVTAENGERNIFTHHPPQLSARTEILNYLREIKPQIVLLDGFYPEVGIKVAEAAKTQGIPVVLDCGSWKPQYNSLLQFAHTAICSADFMPPACHCADDVFSFLKKTPLENIAVSRGEKSILYAGKHSSGELAVKSVEVVDTLGAGDFLHGAFCYYYLQTNCFEQALQKASKIATYSCTVKGTRKWLKHEKMMSFL